MVYTNFEFQKFKSKRRFGVELEVGCTVTKRRIKKEIESLSSLECNISSYALSGDNKYWHVKDDASCGPEGRKGPKGVEIASFVGKGIKDLNHIKAIAEGLQKLGCEVNPNCGFHIHAEAVDLSPLQVGTLFYYWLKLEGILSLALPTHRVENPYCRNLNQTNNFILFKDILKHCNHAFLFWEILKPKDLRYYENDSRRVNFNVVNYARADHHGSNHRKTLELRWPEGTLDGDDIKNWVVLFLGFIDNCSRFKIDTKNIKPYRELSDFLYCFGLHHRTINGPDNALNNTFRIYDKHLHEAKIWLLKRIVKFGSQRIIDLDRTILQNPLSKSFTKKIIHDAKSELKFMNIPLEFSHK